MKRSILFGVLAMFAVSALSVQNVNAQNENEKEGTSSATAINGPKKDKPSTIKEGEATFREMQQNPGQKNDNKAVKKSVKKTNDRTNKKYSRIKKYNGESIQNNSSSDKNEPNVNPNGNVSPKKTKYSGESIKKDANSDKNEPNVNPTGNVSPKKTKYSGESIQNDANSENKNSKEASKGKETNKKKYDGESIQNNSQSSQQKPSNKTIQNESNNKVLPTKPNNLEKTEITPKPNSLPKPKDKITPSTNNTGSNQPKNN